MDDAAGVLSCAEWEISWLIHQTLEKHVYDLGPGLHFAVKFRDVCVVELRSLLICGN